MVYKAVMFGIDDTLLNRDNALEKMFFITLEKYYEDVKIAERNQVLHNFKEYDRRDYGNSNKTRVFESFFYNFPSQNRPHFLKCIRELFHSLKSNCLGQDPLLE